jgi:hypothetical protein
MAARPIRNLVLQLPRAHLAKPVMCVAPMVAVPAVLDDHLFVHRRGSDLRKRNRSLSVGGTHVLPREKLASAGLGYFEIGLLGARTPLLLTTVQLGFGVVTFFELLSPVCLLPRTFRWAWMGVMLPFHFLSLLLLNIFFWQNILLILFFMTDIDRLIDRGRRSGADRNSCRVSEP